MTAPTLDDKLDEQERKWDAAVKDVTSRFEAYRKDAEAQIELIEQRLREAETRAANALWRLPKNSLSSVPDGHVHDSGQGSKISVKEDGTLEGLVFTLDIRDTDVNNVSVSGTEADISLQGYANLAGRSGGQHLIGGTGNNENLQLSSTSGSGGTIIANDNFEVVSGQQLFTNTIYGYTLATKPTFENGLNLNGFPFFLGDSATISSNAITVVGADQSARGEGTEPWVRISATGTLNTVTMTAGTGHFFFMSPASGATVTIAHGAGNISCIGGQNIVLSNIYDFAIFFRHDTNAWSCWGFKTLIDHDHSASGTGGNIDETAITNSSFSAGTVDSSLITQSVIQTNSTIAEIGYDKGADLTIDAAGAITVTHSRHRVDTFASAASDDLVHIDHSMQNQFLILQAANDGRTVVIKNTGGNIECDADITLDNDHDMAILLRDETLDKWIAFAAGGGGAAHAILDGGTAHSDSAADGVTRGSLIVGNSTPAWDELVIGSANYYLRSDGTDAAWDAVDVIAEEIQFLSELTPTIAASQDNWAPTGIGTATRIYVTNSSGSSVNITGITTGAAGRWLHLECSEGTTSPIVLVHDATSTAGNRFYMPSLANITLAAGDSVTLLYDENASAGSGRWKVISRGVTQPVRYVWQPDADPVSDIAAGNHQGPTLKTNKFRIETVAQISISCELAPGTNVVVSLEYNSGNDLDTESWTEIDSITHTGKGTVTTSSFTNSTIPADRLLRMNVVSISGTAPRDMTVILETIL